MSNKPIWVAYVSYPPKTHPEHTARVLKLLLVMNSGSLPDLEDDGTGNGSIATLQNYALGFAQSFEVGDYLIEITTEE